MARNCLKIAREEYQKMSNFKIIYGTADTIFGTCFMGLHKGAICFLKLVRSSSFPLDDLEKAFPGAVLTEDHHLIQTTTKRLFADSDELKIILKGTDFQMQVWEELLNVKKGSTCCYEDIAKAVGNPNAVRAVANAIARNNVWYLIPCHRVISKDGSLNKYGGGVETKLQLLQYEKAM